MDYQEDSSVHLFSTGLTACIKAATQGGKVAKLWNPMPFGYRRGMCARGYLLYMAPQDISEAVFFFR